MGGKKKKSSTKKIAKQRHHGRKPSSSVKTPDLETLLSQADDAVNASDIPTALSLYVAASSILRSRIELQSSTTSVRGSDDDQNCKANSGVDDVIKLAKVLGKAGEARVSLGDREGARSDFADAVSLLSPPADEKKGQETGQYPPSSLVTLLVSSSTMDDGEQMEENEYFIHRKAQVYETRAGLHLYLGQLSSEEEALASYKRGVNDLEACLKILERMEGATIPVRKQIDGDDAMDEEEAKEDREDALIGVRRQLCGAYCSVAELYLTDLCYNSEAETQCEFHLNAALKVSDEDGRPSTDAIQTMANLRLSQRRVYDATSLMLNVYEAMRRGCEALSALVGLARTSTGDKKNEEMSKDDGDEKGNGDEKARELVDVDAANSLPGYEFRCQSAKLLLECASVLRSSSDQGSWTEDERRNKASVCADASVHILGSLIAENDEVIEVWYLLGRAFMTCDPPDSEAAAQYWEKALEMLLTVKVGLEESLAAGEVEVEAEDLKQQLAEIALQIEEVEAKLAELEDSDDAVGKSSAEITPMDET